MKSERIVRLRSGDDRFWIRTFLNYVWKMKTTLVSLFLLIGFFIGEVQSQTVPFEKEVKLIADRLKRDGYQVGSTLFTGSSSIRMWVSLQEDFPQKPIINTGFGGSTAADLKRHLYPLVLQLRPARVFIYEGDNDINNGTSIDEIMSDLEQIVMRIQVVDPNCQIYLISAKPSPSRWDKKEQYLALNEAMKSYTEKKENVGFVDVWTPMLDENGNPKSNIFLQDQLHMNKTGYDIWREIFAKFFPEETPQ